MIPEDVGQNWFMRKLYSFLNYTVIGKIPFGYFTSHLPEVGWVCAGLVYVGVDLKNHPIYTAIGFISVWFLLALSGWIYKHGGFYDYECNTAALRNPISNEKLSKIREIYKIIVGDKK